MKKIISLLLSFVILALPMTSFADDGEAAVMQKVLLKVKEKIQVPPELTEFTGNTSRYNDKITCDFRWRNEEYSKSMSVSCDSEGRIQSYYDSSFDHSEKIISSVSKAEIIDFASSFVRKTLPEAFHGENDGLFYDESSYDVRGNLSYNLKFNRLKNSVPVKNNYVDLTVCIKDDTMYIRNMNSSFNYDIAFAAESKELADYVAKYKEAFPVELVYADEYNPMVKSGEPCNLPRLVYRIKDDSIGYIDITTGDVITEDTFDETFRKENGMAADSVQNSTVSGGSSLTEQEIAELGTIKGLAGVETIEKNIKKLPYIKFTSDLKLVSKELYKDSYGDYYYRLTYSNEADKDYRYFSVNVNAASGEIIRLNNNYNTLSGSDVSLTENEVSSANKKIDEFLNTVCKDKLSQTSERQSDSYSSYVNRSFVRLVNGIKYIDNGISISFDAKNNTVRSFNVNFTKGEFPDPRDAISADDAYEKILAYSPSKPVYICSDGVYKKAVSLEKYFSTLDALSGEIKNAYVSLQYGYDDIKGHWAEEAATKLSEIQIGLEGNLLKPEAEITQEEFLRLVCSGILSKYYSDYDTEELYEILISEKIITEDEKAPGETVKREDAFVYIIRLAGFEAVAKLSDIYKVNYSDGYLLSDGKIGYAAILSGMGVVCGNGGYLRPDDCLTRAEALTLLYKYLLTI